MEAASVRQSDLNRQTELSAERTTGTTYFEAYRGSVRTSNLTLASLNILPAAELEKALKVLKDPLQDKQQALHSELQSRFPQLSYILAAGHSLLFHGYGSKKSVLDDFAEHQADYTPVLVVNGFNPTISLRTVLGQLASDVLGITGTFAKRTLLDYVEAIRAGIGSKEATLVVHNIDGPALRAAETQNALAQLSTVPNLGLVASVDHMNAPLLWDGVMYSRFAWAWIKADTFVPYVVETVFCSKPLLHGGGERQVEGAIALLNSLSERARKVFRELAKRQTGGAVLREGESKDDAEGPQMRTTFNELFELSKEQFLASDPTSLQVILTELQTHQLLECRRGADAASQLWIPLHLSQLRDIVKAVESAS